METEEVNGRQRSEGADRKDPSAQLVAHLAKRLDTLERRQRRSRRVGGLFALGLFAAASMGAAPSVPDVLSARAFELVDAAGRVRASWTVRSQDGVEMVVFDDSGKRTTAMELTEADPYLAVVSARDVRKQAQGRRWFSWGQPKTDTDKSPESNGRPSSEGQKPEDDEGGGFEWDGR